MTTFVPLVGKQLASFDAADAAGNVWEGAVRSSKTIVSLLRWIRFVREGPTGPLLMLGRTERTLKRNVLDPLTDMLGASRFKISHGAGEANLLGRTIYLAGANDERAADKIKGMTLAGAYGDELTTWPESVFDIMRTRLSVPGAQWFGTTNPGAPAHFLKKKHLNNAKMTIGRDGKVKRSADPNKFDLNVFSFTLRDNPSLTPGFIAQLEREYSGVFRKRHIEGLWVQAEGAVYDSFDEDLHVVDTVPHIMRWISVGIDYGTSNPFHAVLIGLGIDRCLYVASEWRHDSRAVGRQLPDTQYSAAVKSWLASIKLPGAPGLIGVEPEYVCVDPSAASFRVQAYRDGLFTVPADNSVADGIRVFDSLLANYKIKFLRTGCPELITEIPGYAWDDRAAREGRDEPVKVDDHGCDAARYGVYTPHSAWRDDVYDLAA